MGEALNWVTQWPKPVPSLALPAGPAARCIPGTCVMLLGEEESGEVLKDKPPSHYFSEPHALPQSETLFMKTATQPCTGCGTTCETEINLPALPRHPGLQAVRSRPPASCSTASCSFKHQDPPHLCPLQPPRLSQSSWTVACRCLIQAAFCVKSDIFDSRIRTPGICSPRTSFFCTPGWLPGEQLCFAWCPVDHQQPLGSQPPRADLTRQLQDKVCV